MTDGVDQRKLQEVWADATLRLLPRCELYVVQQSPGRTAEESLSLRGNNHQKIIINLLCKFIPFLLYKEGRG